ncbi:zwei Ig domain protein zig-8 [Culicoides brevitarsis]|uniref:zwei Ig domain protein zig-8 n=1 Tax=Culicoides brevitarsis TaxID=469753 RepID=UPI00307BB2A0
MGAHKNRLLLKIGLYFIILFHKVKVTLNTSVTSTISPASLQPYFDFNVQRNITVTVGQTGFLNCRVERLGDKDVSFIRKKDLHILTAGTLTYTSDQRFTVLRRENPSMWTLQIKYPQISDSGTYECQINTEPKMSLSYTFNVVELKAQILGPNDLYVKSGSQIIINCKLTQGPHDLGSILWYKGNEIVDTSIQQNSISQINNKKYHDRISIETDWSDGLKSTLTIKRAIQSDTGNYTCVPTIAKSSSVWVQVISGEHPAAMQHNSAPSLLFVFSDSRRHNCQKSSFVKKLIYFRTVGIYVILMVFVAILQQLPSLVLIQNRFNSR